MRLARSSTFACLVLFARVLAASTASSSPPTLLSPLAVDDGLAASIGELRGDRLHMGIDYRTQQKTGLPVRVVADGVVVRLKEQWRGYGLAVYVQHRDGLMSVYGHLDRVIAPLEARLKKARATRRSRWAGDVVISSPFPIAQGQILAWSGESGAGLPHLHLEIRRGMDEAVDPFAAGLELPKDETPPIAKQIILTPTGPGASVDGSRRAATIDLSLKDGRYVAAHRPKVVGAVDLTLDAYDQVGAANHAGLGGLRVVLDDRELYQLRFRSIAYSQSNTAGAILDLGQSSIGKTRYTYRLTRLPGSGLPLISGHTGPLQLERGPHKLVVELSDATPQTEPRSIVVLGLDAVASATANSATPAAAALAGSIAGLDIELRGDRVYLFAEVATAGTGAATPPAKIAAKLDDLAPSLQLVTGRGYEGEVEAFGGKHVFSVGGHELPFAVATMRTDRLDELAFGAVTLRAPAGALYTQAMFAVREVNDLPVEKGLKLRAPATRFLPDGHALQMPARVAFTEALGGPKSGVYRYEPATSSWSFLDLGTAAEVRRLATYALLDDLAAPTIDSVAPEPTNALRPGPIELVVKVTDVGTGIPERGVTMSVGGSSLDVLYDPDRDQAQASWKAVVGEHKLLIRVADYVGNASERIVMLRVVE